MPRIPPFLPLPALGVQRFFQLQSGDLLLRREDFRQRRAAVQKEITVEAFQQRLDFVAFEGFGGDLPLQRGEFEAQRDELGIFADDQRRLRGKEAVNQAHRLRVMPICQCGDDGGEGFARRAIQLRQHGTQRGQLLDNQVFIGQRHRGADNFQTFDEGLQHGD